MTYNQPPPGYGYEPRPESGQYHAPPPWEQQSAPWQQPPPPPAPGPGRARRRRRRWPVILAICAAGFLLLVIIGTALSGGGTPAAGTSSPAATAASAPASQPATAGSSLGARLGAWNSGPGGKAMRTVAAQLSVMGNAATSGNLAATGKACGVLSADVAAALGSPPIPDAATEHWYALALAQYQQAAADCQAGVSASDAASIQAASRHLTTGSTYLGKATARIQAIAAG